MKRYEVVPSRFWRHVRTAVTASLYGACPWMKESEREDWQIVERGFTVRDNVQGTVGLGRKPFDSEAEALACVARLEGLRG